MIELSICQLAQYAIEGNELGIISLRFLCACLLLGLFAWSLISPLIAAIAEARQMHRVPCSNCSFFTNDYRLKCTVKPFIATTKEAINCCDYSKNS